MVPRSLRLPRKEFSAHGYRVLRTPFFLLKMKENEKHVLRMGIVVGKNVHKSAAKRNFWKRQAKAALLRGSLPPEDFLMILMPKVNTLTRRQFQLEVEKAIRVIKK